MFAIVDYFEMLPLSKFWFFAENLAGLKNPIVPSATE